MNAPQTPEVIPDTSGQTPFIVCMIIGTWVEGMGYGVFLSLYLTSLWLMKGRTVASKATGRRDHTFLIMFSISTLMFFIATFHMTIAGYRLAWVWIVGDNLAPPITSLTNLNSWDMGLWTGLYITQELLGTGAAIYRCWLLWHKDWRVVALPIFLLLAETGFGYSCLAMFAQSDPLKGKLNPLVQYWMQAFYALAVLSNLIPTSLMVFQLWKTHHKSAHSAILTPSILYPVVRILIESASLQLIVELILLGLFDSGRQEQFIVLGLITPIVGITFSLITIRIKLVSQSKSAREQVSIPTSSDSNWRFDNPTQTIGSSARSPRGVSIYMSSVVTTNKDSIIDISSDFKQASDVIS